MKKSAISRLFLAAAVATLIVATAAGAQVEIDSNTFGGLRARALGPATMSGRIAAIDAHADDPLDIWVGAASGGVWHSKDGGIVFRPVFDDHTQSIGAIRIAPADPETIWVGTGETWVRNSTSVGTGVYKTTDGGDSWQLMGLEESERIARIHVHPEEADTVWVCATGQLWSANEQRGVYKTTDGGETWEAVLQVDENTGCSDLAIDPQDPNILYAGMWQFRRYPDFFESGGPGSGLYKSSDGGETWTELTNGLPEGEMGRIGVAVAPSRPSRLYAVVESETSALYRSDDLGASWEEVNTSFNVGARPFYFAYVVVDPEDHERVYKPGFFLAVSTDGGEAFTSIFSGFGSSVHSDHHALWINPNNAHEVLLGTDGGVYMSYDRAAQWRLIKQLPVAQFYEVSTDDEWPYNVYGGLQDNGTWRGPSRSPGGIEVKDWELLGFGDGFHAYRDPHDTNIVFVEYQGGNILRHHLATGEIKGIAPLPDEGEEDYRFNWNTALHLSPNTPGTLYAGAQYLFRSQDRGERWEKISPDLTTNDPQRQRQKTSGGLTIDNTTAENNATIYTISESPLDGSVIWVGTDDGLVQVTRDGGETWTNVTAGMPDLPAGLWVSHVEASPHDAATAHVTVDGHRSGDMATYVYRTTDYGATWSSLAKEDLEGYAHVVVQDPENADLLYMGTEFGLWISLDAGQNWGRFEGGMPKRAPVRDIDIQRREGDLVVGTHGRGVYILDDLSPLRALTAETLGSKLALLPSRDAVMVLSAGLSWFSGDDEYTGPNPTEAATIFYYQNKRHIFGDMKIEIYDADGELVSNVPAGKLKGLNRAEWPMRLEPPKMPPATTLAPAFVGPRVPEGEYTFKLIKGKETYEGKVRLVADPRSPHSPEDRAVQQETAMRLYRSLESLTYVVDSLIDLRDQAKDRKEATSGRLAERLQEYVDELETLRGDVVSTSDGGIFAGDEKLREKMANLYANVTGYDGRPTGSQLDRTQVFENDVAAASDRFDVLAGERLVALNDQLGRKGLEALEVLTLEAWEAKQEEAGGGTMTANVSAEEMRKLLMGVTGPVFSLGL